MRILVIGDVVGTSGKTYLKENLKKMKQEKNIDFVIANGENTAGGVGIDPVSATELFDSGVNAITLGNHTWRKKEVIKVLEDSRVVRPVNYLEGTEGKGSRILTCKNKKIGIINAVGRVYMDPVGNPFVAISKEVEEIRDKCDIIIVDFHAEATSEKIAMGYFLDGRVNFVYGTHTHVQTADAKVLPKGTAYVTDVGMTGPKESVIGADRFVVVRIFSTEIPDRMPNAGGAAQFNGAIIEIDDETNKTISVNTIICE